MAELCRPAAGQSAEQSCAAWAQPGLEEQAASASVEQASVAQLAKLAARALPILAEPVALVAAPDVQVLQVVLLRSARAAAMAAEPAAELGLEDAAVEQPAAVVVRPPQASGVQVLVAAPQPWAVPVSFQPEELPVAPAVL